ncbi:MAG: endolytic transglycosylase MltG [Chloroflexi bacterium]|nr:endolytic transglycosylase MltG [Chloroflexota bacterium]
MRSRTKRQGTLSPPPHPRRTSPRRETPRTWWRRLLTPRTPWEILRLLLLGLIFVALGAAFLIVKSRVEAQLVAVPPPSRLVEPQESPLERLNPDTFEDTVLGWYLGLRASDLNSPPSTSDEPVDFVVEKGETARSIARRLEEKGLITDAKLFELYLRYYGLGTKLEAGHFILRRNMTMPEIARALQQARAEEVVITIKEGWRMEEIAEYLGEERVVDAQEFLSLARTPSALSPDIRNRHAFLQALPPGATLEGYLFPETYRVAVGSSPEAIIAVMLKTFDERVPTKWREDAAARGYTLHQIVTMASIIERETPRADERPLVASVYWNRLEGRCPEAGAYLQADPTVQYAMGRPGEWWWKPPSVEIYSQIQSPYNTYLHPGLPPGPIANPGLSAIKAAVYPAQTRYCFFVATGDGGHVFAVTLAEHERNIEMYQGK